MSGISASGSKELIRRIFTISRIDLAFLYAILFGMSVKPTSDDGWTILTGAAILVALTAIFIAQVRSGGPEQRAPAAAD